jgi:hypothetical protein
VVPEIKVPVSVGPIIPSLGTVNVTIGEDTTSVPINGQALNITVDGDLVNERDAAATPDAEASGPDAQPVDQGVTLPASAELVGATTPEDVRASSCTQEPAPQPTPEPQPEPTPEPQPQPEQPQASGQSTSQGETPASPTTTSQPASNPQHRPATTGQDKATKSKKSKAAKKSKKANKKVKTKKRSKKSKKGKRSRR